jgi:hypothetical protein
LEKKKYSTLPHHQSERWQSNPGNAAAAKKQKFKESNKALIVHQPTHHPPASARRRDIHQPDVTLLFFDLHQRHGITLIFFSKVPAECLQHCSAQPHCQQQTRQWNTGVKDTEGERTTEPTEPGSNLVSLSFSVRFLFAIITDIRNGSQGMLEFLYYTIFQPSLCFRITLYRSHGVREQT